VEGKIANALLSSLKEPSSFLFGLLEDPTDAEQDASDYNKRQLERIEDSIQSTQSVITEKMDDLWELYKDRKSTRLNSSHVSISYAVFCLTKKMEITSQSPDP